MKKCPYCAEEIQDEAIFCRYCNRDLIPVEKPQPTQVADKEIMTKCPSCMAEIPTGAMTCMHCGKSTSRMALAGNALTQVGCSIMILVLLIPFLCYIANLFLGI